MKGDVDWLRKNLAQALGWDEQLTEGVAEAIAAAGSRQEVEELTQVLRHVQRKSILIYFISAYHCRPHMTDALYCRITWEEVTRCTTSSRNSWEKARWLRNLITCCSCHTASISSQHAGSLAEAARSDVRTISLGMGPILYCG